MKCRTYGVYAFQNEAKGLVCIATVALASAIVLAASSSVGVFFGAYIAASPAPHFLHEEKVACTIRQWAVVCCRLPSVKAFPAGFKEDKAKD